MLALDFFLSFLKKMQKMQVVEGPAKLFFGFFLHNVGDAKMHVFSQNFFYIFKIWDFFFQIFEIIYTFYKKNVHFCTQTEQ